MTKPTKRVTLYLRVSTTEQTTDNQRLELDAVIKRCGWNTVEVYGWFFCIGRRSV